MTLVYAAGGASSSSSTAAVLDYDPAEACSSSATRLYQGYQVTSNATIPANTPFAWDAQGSGTATWSPDQFGTAFKGAYAAGTTYTIGQVVAADATSTALYTATSAAGNIGQSLANTTYWTPASFTVTQSVLNILSYSIGNTYYAGQRVHINGMVVIPNATIPAGTAFALGTTGATWKLDTSPVAATYAVNTEYVSPNQHGGVYGIVYRTYFGATLPSYLTSGNPVSGVIDYILRYTVSGTTRGLAIGWSDSGTGGAMINLSGSTGKGNLSIYTYGGAIVVNSGWVDYTK